MTNMSNVDLYYANQEENNCEGASVRTDASDADEFLDAFAAALSKVFFIPNQPLNTIIQPIPNQRLALRKWLGQAVDIYCKLKGYKAEKVYERRVLWSGDVQPYEAWAIVSGTDGVIGDEPNGHIQKLLQHAFASSYGGPNIELQKKLMDAIGREASEAIAQSSIEGDSWLHEELIDR